MAVDPQDIGLIDRLRNGDKSALYLLYDKYSSALYGVILRICRDEDQAKDLLQETFVKIWQKISTYDQSKGRFYTWAYRIAKHTTLNALRKSKPLIQTEDLSVYSNIASEEESPDYAVLNGLLKKLEPHHQRAIQLVYFQGYTHREAHELMKVPLGTFKSYIRQAIKQIREKYGQNALLFLTIIEALGNGQ
ncbi:MAG: RNA polymerase sigma factor [Flavobacteriaceae bacterium]